MRRILFLMAMASSAGGGWALESGLKADETVTSFTSRNVAGPYKNLELCLPCKFGTSTAIQVWISKEDAEKLPGIVARLDAFAKLNPAIKVCVIASDEKRKSEFEKLKADEVPIAVLSAAQNEVAQKYKIDPESKSTVLVYRAKKVRFNYVDVPDGGWDAIFDAAKALRQEAKP